MTDPIEVPYLDLKAQYRSIKPEIDAAVANVLESCQFILGPEVASFEREFASYCGASECIALNSGTSALHLALLAAGEHRGAAAERGIRWLTQTQRADGSWDQPQYTGTGFPGDVYINYHLYRLAFPISALGRYVSLTHPEVAHDGDDPAS